MNKLYLLLVSFLISLKSFCLVVIDFVVFVVVFFSEIELEEICEILLDIYEILSPIIYIIVLFLLLLVIEIYFRYCEYLDLCEHLYLHNFDPNANYYLLGFYFWILYLYIVYKYAKKEPENSFIRDEFSVDESLNDDAFVLEPLIYIFIFTSIFIFVFCVLNYFHNKNKNEKKKAMPQLDIAILSYVLIVLIIFFIIGYLFTLVIINRVYYIVMIRNYFFVKFEFNLIQQLDNFLLKNNFLLYLLDLKVIGLSELLIENIINNFINYLLLIKKIYFKLNF